MISGRINHHASPASPDSETVMADSNPANIAKPIVIACAADHAYAIPLTVMLRSDLSRLSDGQKAEIYLAAEELDVNSKSANRFRAMPR